MKVKNSVILTFWFTTIAWMYSGPLTAQSKEILSSDELIKKITDLDSAFFHAFNVCDIDRSKSFFTEDLEFYHDVGGLSNYSENLKSILKRCSGETKLRRELVKGSLQIFPIKNYGAIEVGSHSFFYTEKGQKEQFDGTYRFLHIWKYIDGKWKISRIVSYDH